MALHVKSHSSHDALLLCLVCHDNYETHATALKKDIATRVGVPIEGRGWIKHPEHRRVQLACSALESFRHKIPDARIQELEATVRTFFRLEGNQPVDERIYEQARQLPVLTKSDDFVEHGEYVVSQMTEGEIDDFVRSWRRHFLEHANPRFLSPTWRVHNPISTQ